MRLTQVIFTGWDTYSRKYSNAYFAFVGMKIIHTKTDSFIIEIKLTLPLAISLYYPRGSSTSPLTQSLKFCQCAVVVHSDTAVYNRWTGFALTYTFKVISALSSARTLQWRRHSNDAMHMSYCSCMCIAYILYSNTVCSRWRWPLQLTLRFCRQHNLEPFLCANATSRPHFSNNNCPYYAYSNTSRPWTPPCSAALSVRLGWNK